MELQSIKQIAEEQGVSYEAIRIQIKRYAEDLEGHISVKNRTQFLDEWAVEFLKQKRRENPIIVMNEDRSEEVLRLKEEVESLRVQLLTAQNELIKGKDRIIELQDEAKKTIEDRAKYTALLEDNEAKTKKLKEAEEREVELTHRVETIQTEAEGLRGTIQDLQRERDEAQREAQSFTRSIFGFYRKK